MAIKDLNVLDQYKRFFVDRPFTFPGDETVNWKTALHRVDNDFPGYFSAIENHNPEIPYIYASEMDLIYPGFLAKNHYDKNSDMIP
ncbi:hypothetical protein HHL23_21375 [Chryseobacterium sp. RP-3-3]|uniref:Uncharacterized protein n=1 Tax=Chryseobacterium antibioticum TaxID=2728847 RepID=A0A7Y0FUA0_9FLAO|nr:hypothetical protein [Chryseobacterium antibioticum]NML72314.1 hypothetical protein [Chryseobacterium antibioticum]